METINICLKIVTENKKAVKESFQLKQFPKFASAVELKNYIVSEKVKAANVESLETTTALREVLALPLLMKLPWLRRIPPKSKSG